MYYNLTKHLEKMNIAKEDTLPCWSSLEFLPNIEMSIESLINGFVDMSAVGYPTNTNITSEVIVVKYTYDQMNDGTFDNDINTLLSNGYSFKTRKRRNSPITKIMINIEALKTAQDTIGYRLA